MFISASILISEKAEHIYYSSPHNILRFTGVEPSSKSVSELLRVERAVLSKMKFRVHGKPTFFNFILRFCHLLNLSKSVKNTSLFVAHLFSLGVDGVKTLPSMIAFAAINVGCKIKKRESVLNDDNLKECFLMDGRDEIEEYGMQINKMSKQMIALVLKSL